MQHTMTRLCGFLTALLAFALATPESSHNPGRDGLSSLPATQFTEGAEKRQLCSGLSPGNPAAWWRAIIGHNGTTPYSADGGYRYYRTAKGYGADNTGIVDASPAINNAIKAGGRPGNTVTTMPVYVYVEPGTYLIANPIQMYVNTFLIGDALNPPTFVAAPSLVGSWKPTVIYGYDPLQGENGATKNFYMAVRNLVINLGALDPKKEAVGIDWSASQGSILSNVHVKMQKFSNHTGIAMSAGGSGTIISDSVIEGGAVGIALLNQQYNIKNVKFHGTVVGIYIHSIFVATFQGLEFMDCDYGVDMARERSAGVVSLVDSSVSNCKAGVKAFVSGGGQGSLVVDNFRVDSAAGVKSSTGATLLLGSVPLGQTWVMGNESPQSYQGGTMHPITRPPALMVDGKYFTMPAPQYETYDISQVVSVKGDPQFTVYGDNKHNDGPAINGLLKKYAGCKILFFPQGIYLTEETISIPPGTRMVGEVFSTITGTGSTFTDAAHPQPIVQVGRPGETGVAQISDMLFSTAAVLPGAVVVQVHLAGPRPGDVGFWNVVVRVGGSVDSLAARTCGGRDPAGCKAAFALVHVGPTASGYFENLWGWVADHALDPDLPVQNIAVGRGLLVQSTRPTWFVGTAFEHAVLYQYNLHGAANVFIGMQQTESPYWQGVGTPLRAPAPWTPDPAWGDPDFTNCATTAAGPPEQCARAWAVHSTGARDAVLHGSALWAFYNGAVEADVAAAASWRDGACNRTGRVCQTNMAYLDAGGPVAWFGLGSNTAVNMVLDRTGGAGEGEGRVETQAGNAGGWGGVVAAYLRQAEHPVKGAVGPDGGGGKGGAQGVGGGGEGGGKGGEKKGVAARGGGETARWACFLSLGLGVLVTTGLLAV